MLRTNRILGILVFTVVEVITMVLWLKFAPDKPVLAVVILAVGLFIEHYVSVNVAAGRALEANVDRGVPRAG